MEKKKKRKLTIIAIVVVVIIYAINKDVPKVNIPPVSIEQIKKDSIELAQKLKIEKIENIKKDRAKKIDYALTGLKMMIIKNMNDSDSFKMHKRIYDKNAKGDTIGLIIEYSGKNAFGGRVKDVVYGSYSIEKDKIWITKKPN